MMLLIVMVVVNPTMEQHHYHTQLVVGITATTIAIPLNQPKAHVSKNRSISHLEPKAKAKAKAENSHLRIDKRDPKILPPRRLILSLSLSL